MCGIAGLLTASSDENHFRQRIEWMQKSLNHRGPDDRGIYITPDQTVALAHTRLAILDLSPAGHQPMSTADGRYWITFNGEIYNFQTLRSQLTTEGEQFHSQTDTEVILKLYQRYGSHCVHQIRGMFTFAIWDNLEKTCFLARDPFGIKPLYYWQSGSTLVFASELRAVLASRLPPVSLSRDGLYGYLTTGSVPEPYTLIEDIHCLPAGHWLQWKAGQSIQKQYWQIQFNPEPISPEDATAKVRAALLDSIQHHFISDVPVGIFLSGGIDSTAIVALARQTQSGTLKTYSIAFEETAWNEGHLAQQTAQTFETQHTEYKITAALGKTLFPQFLETIDQPSIDGFNTFCVSRVAHQDGAKVVLSGLGGDELFGGYGSFKTIPQLVQRTTSFKVASPLSRSLGMGLSQFSPSSKMKRLGDFLQQPPNSSSAYKAFRGIFSHQEACSILHQYLPHVDLPQRQISLLPTSFSSLEDEVSALEISQYMRNQLLRDSDVMSMAWGLELRVPFVDHTLFDAIRSIPSSLRLATNKALLVQAVPELPQNVVNYPKHGFSFPLQHWIEQEWKEYFAILPPGKNISLNHWYRRWSLVLLQYWWNKVAA